MVAQSTTQDDLFGFEPRVTTSVFDALSCCSTIESPAPVTDLVSRGKKLVHDCRPITALCEIYTTTSVIRPCSFPSPHATHAPLRTTLLPHDPSRPYPGNGMKTIDFIPYIKQSGELIPLTLSFRLYPRSLHPLLVTLFPSVSSPVILPHSSSFLQPLMDFLLISSSPRH